MRRYCTWFRSIDASHQKYHNTYHNTLLLINIYIIRIHLSISVINTQKQCYNLSSINPQCIRLTISKICHFKVIYSILLVDTLRYIDASDRYLICCIDIHIETLCTVIHRCITVSFHFYSRYVLDTILHTDRVTV